MITEKLDKLKDALLNNALDKANILLNELKTDVNNSSDEALESIKWESFFFAGTILETKRDYIDLLIEVKQKYGLTFFDSVKL